MATIMDPRILYSIDRRMYVTGLHWVTSGDNKFIAVYAINQSHQG